MSANDNNNINSLSTENSENNPEIPTIVQCKILNLNSYASKKSFAQGMLDLALLASNATQLKYILTMGDSHEFYTLILSLVITSICLQVAQVIICLILGLILDINKVSEQRIADITNNIALSITVAVVAINIIISGFDIKAMSDIIPYKISGKDITIINV